MSGTEPILLLPGNMCDDRMWAPLAARLDAASWTSRSVSLAEDDTIPGMAARVLRHAPERFVLIGFSMGAIVALEVMRQAGARVTALGLIACNPTADLPERAAVRPRQQADVRAGRLAELVADELKPNYLAEQNRQDRPLLDLTMHMAEALGPEVFIRQSEALRLRADLRPVLPTITCPTFMACGAEDRLCPPDWHRVTAARIADATLHVIPGAGHLLPLEQPDALADTLIPWLEKDRP